MLIETGRVVAVEPDGVWVETIRQTTCGSCAAQKGCGHGIVNRIYDGQRSLIRALPGKISPAECTVDDEVQISIPEEVILKGSLVVYILPLLAMMVGAAAGGYAFPAGGDVTAAAGAVAGFALGYLLVRWHARAHRDDRRLQPELVAITGHRPEPVKLA